MRLRPAATVAATADGDRQGVQVHCCVLQPTPGVFDPASQHNLDFVAMQFSSYQIGNLMQAVATASPPVTALLGPNEPNDFQQVWSNCCLSRTQSAEQIT